MKKAGISILMFILTAPAFGQSSSSQALPGDSGPYIIDTNRIAILKVVQNSGNNIRTAIELSDKEWRKIDSVLSNLLDSSLNVKGKRTSKNLDKYRLQYVPYLNEKGERIAGINAFCDFKHFKNWRKEIVHVEDGGFCFFNIEINLSTGIAGKIIFNGFG